MLWQFYLLISILLISSNALFHRSLLKDDQSNPAAQTIVFLGLGGILVIIIGLLQGTINLTIPKFLIPNFLLLVILAVPAYLLIYRAYQLIGASEVALFLATSKLWNVVGAFLFLHETVTVLKILGAIIIVLGLAIVLYDKKKFTLNKGVVFTLLAAFLFGMGDINGFYILKTFNAASFLVYAQFLPVIALFVIKPNTIKKLNFYFQKDKATKALLLALCDILGSFAFIYAFQSGGKASVIGPLSATRVLVTTILAIVILKERQNITNKIIGAAVAVAGVILLL